MPNTDRLPVTEISGTPSACGLSYGRQFATRIIGFCKQELRPNPRRLAYARRCWKHVERDAPASAAFLRGMARGANISLDHAALLSLHEEIYHEPQPKPPHCTAFAARGRATRGGQTIVAMNWDWGPNLYPWPGLLRLRLKGSPAIASYHYPGLWVGAGVNEAGLAFMWTGGGYFPKIQGVVGMPTYVVIPELLRHETVKDAIQWLAGIKHAGSFIFFLGDATGATAIVEGVPGHTEVVAGDDTLSRGNHYFCRSVITCGKQVAPKPGKMVTTIARTNRMAELMKQHSGRISPEVTQRILTDRAGRWPWLHQWPAGPDATGLNGMTIDSLFAVCQTKTLWTTRGGAEPGPWQKLTA